MYYDRPGIKQWARQRLAAYRWPPVLVCLVASLLGAASGGYSGNLNLESNAEEGTTNLPFLGELSPDLLPVILWVMGAVLVLALAYAIFVANVVHVGQQGWMLRVANGENPPVGELFAAFRIYRPAMSTMLLSQVYTFFWSLLFLIPGIVKAYSYIMAPYIIYEYPNLSANQAITLSRKMTHGYKGEIFVLELSFFGWSLLSALTAGIVGILYVQPYQNLSLAGTYQWLKHNALQTGRITWEELGIWTPAAPQWPAPEVPEDHV